MDSLADDSIRATVQMSPLQLEGILVHERTTAEDLVIELTKRKSRWKSYTLKSYHLIALGFMTGAALGLAAVSLIY